MIHKEHGNLLCKKREASVLLEFEAHKLAPKTKPKPTCAPSSSHSPIHIPIHQRNWLDVEPKQHSQKDANCFTFSKKMIALLRHGTLLRWSSGILEIESRIYVELPQSPHSSVQLWSNHLETGGGHKMYSEYTPTACMTSYSLFTSTHECECACLWLKVQDG